MLEPAHLVPLPEIHVAVELVRTAMARMQQRRDEVQSQAGDQHRGDGHNRQRPAAAIQARADDRPFVSAEDALDAGKRVRVNVPDVAGKVRHVRNTAVVRGVEPVVHAGREPQRHVGPRGELLRQRGVAQKFLQRVARALRLQRHPSFHRTAGADDGVAGADEDIGARIHRAGAFLQFAREAVVQAAERGPARVRQVEVREQLPRGDRRIAHERLFDLAEPSHETRQGRPGNAVGQREVEWFVPHQRLDECAEIHGAVIPLR